MLRSISSALRKSTGRSSTPSDGAAAWITANCPTPWGMLASRRTAARVTRGAISLSSSSHFVPRPYSYPVNPDPAAWPRQARDIASTDRIDGQREHNWRRAARFEQRPNYGAARGQNDVRCQRDQFRRLSTHAVGIACGPTGVDADIAAIGPAQLL